MKGLYGTVSLSGTSSTLIPCYCLISIVFDFSGSNFGSLGVCRSGCESGPFSSNDTTRRRRWGVNGKRLGIRGRRGQSRRNCFPPLASVHDGMHQRRDSNFHSFATSPRLRGELVAILRAELPWCGLRFLYDIVIFVSSVRGVLVQVLPSDAPKKALGLTPNRVL